MTSTSDTKREAQVLELLMAGHHDAQIAQALNLAVGTVRRYATELRLRRFVPTRKALIAHVWLERQDQWLAKEAGYVARISALETTAASAARIRVLEAELVEARRVAASR